MAQQQKPPASEQRTGQPTALSSGWFALPSTARILPFAAYMAFIVIADLLGRLGWTANDLRWLYPVKIAVVVALLLAYWRTYVELYPKRLGARTSLLSVLVGVAVLVVWVNLDAGWMRVGESAGFDPTGGSARVDWLLVALRIAGAALVVPVMEELFWRSFLMRWLERREFLQVYPAGVRLVSLAICSALFGIEHDFWLAGIAAGLAYGWLYMRTGNLWAPIVAHAVTNGLLGIWVVMTSSWTYW